MKIGIIGFGSFGKLLSELLSAHASVIVLSRPSIDTKSLPAGVAIGDYEDFRLCDVIVISVGLCSFRYVCDQLKNIVTAETIVMDVCSVKIEPSEIMQELLGDKCRLLSTHPMFGPQPVAENGGTKGLKMVWHDLSGGPFEELKSLFADNLCLDIVELSPDEHDRQMAWVHGLTFFVGRGLVNMNIPKTMIDTGYFRKLLDLHNLELKQSLDLFYTVERGNPYAQKIRQSFMQTLAGLENEIENK